MKPHMPRPAPCRAWLEMPMKMPARQGLAGTSEKAGHSAGRRLSRTLAASSGAPGWSARPTICGGCRTSSMNSSRDAEPTPPDGEARSESHQHNRPDFFQAGHMMAPQRAAQVFEKHTDSIDRLPLQKCSYSRADGRSYGVLKQYGPHQLILLCLVAHQASGTPVQPENKHAS